MKPRTRALIHALHEFEQRGWRVGWTVAELVIRLRRWYRAANRQEAVAYLLSQRD